MSIVFFDKVVKLIGGGYVINGAYPSTFCLASTLDFQQHDKRVRVIIMDNPLILAMAKNNLAPGS